MTSNRFFIKKINLHTIFNVLSGEEHHHLKNVARLKPGDMVWLLDEAGQNYMARIEKIEKDQTRLSILEKGEKSESKVKITLAQALIKAKYMEIILQKATELGISEFLPVRTIRSIVKIGYNLDVKLTRWNKIVREAAKQSGVSQIPAVLPPKNLKDVLQMRTDTLKIFLSERGGTPLRQFIIPVSSKSRPERMPSSALILIGPEGGWTEEEEEDILSHSFEAASLGHRILRTETAAIGSLAIIDHFWNQ